MVETRPFINAEFTSSALGETFSLFNPATEFKVADVEIASKADVDRAVAAAKAAQPAWAGLPAGARAAALYKLAELVESPKHAERLKELDAISMGRPVGPQAFDVMISAIRLRFEAGLAQSLVGQSSLNSPGALNIVLRQPFGVTAAIIPWNVPVMMWVGKVAPSVAAGIAMILKSSEKSPLAALYLAGLTVEAGFPPGIVQVLSGLGATGKLLSEHMEIRKISFTGSTRTGQLIAAAAAMSNLKAVSLELGGKSPSIIFDDADIDQAVGGCAFSIQFNAGQLCMANTRLYVHEKIATEFMTKFKAAYGTFKHGDPVDPTTSDGPQADEAQLKSILGFIEIGKKDGKLELGGHRVGDKGHYIHPTIFSNVPDDSEINKKEVFGPVVIIHTFTDEDEAIRRANDSEFGLYASVFTKNIDRAIRVAKALDAGMVGVNTTSPSGASDMPFGGWKASGQGREEGIESVKRWTEEKSVFIKFS